MVRSPTLLGVGMANLRVIRDNTSSGNLLLAVSIGLGTGKMGVSSPFPNRSKPAVSWKLTCKTLFSLKGPILKYAPDGSKRGPVTPLISFGPSQ